MLPDGRRALDPCPRRERAEGSAPPTGIAGINIDITARKQVEEELRQSKREARTRFREVRALYQHAPVGLALLDLDMRFLRVNEFLRDITGLAAEEHVGRSIFEILPDLRDGLEPALRQVHRDRRADPQHRGRGRHAASTRRQGLVAIPRLHLTDDYGATPGLGLVAEDVTAQKRAEYARDLLGRELSHRIKNLFAVVVSIVTLSARGNDALKDFARTIRGPDRGARARP